MQLSSWSGKISPTSCKWTSGARLAATVQVLPLSLNSRLTELLKSTLAQGRQDERDSRYAREAEEPKPQQINVSLNPKP